MCSPMVSASPMSLQQAPPTPHSLDGMMFQMQMPTPDLRAINLDWNAQQAFQQCPVGYTPMVLNPHTGQLVPLVEAQYVAQTQSTTPFVRPEPEVFIPRSEGERMSIDSTPSNVGEMSEGEENNQEQRESSAPVQKKYAFRSKQRKIDKVRGMIKDHFDLRGLFAAEKELVRGEDTVRVHVKTFPGLTKIQEALKEIEDHPQIQITRIACPFSKKNKKQKKGFIVYLKVATVPQKEMVQEIFGKYEEWLKNCVTARPRAMPLEKTIDMCGNNDNGFSLTPPIMVKVASGG